MKYLWIWIARDLIEEVNNSLILAYLKLFLRAGCGYRQARENLQKLLVDSTNQKTIEHYFSEELEAKLALCAMLGTAEDEVSFHLQSAPEKLIKQLVRFRTGVNIALQLFIFTIIGSLVIAFYLPIFSLGSAI